MFLAFVAGTSAGALATALGLWLLSGLGEPLPDSWRPALLVALAGLALLLRHGPLTRLASLPESRRQIPAETLGGGAARGALRFGLELGTGVRTYAPALAPYMLALTILVARPGLYLALLAGLGYGIARGLPLLVRALAPEITMESVRHRAARIAPGIASLTVFLGGATLVY